MLEMFLKRMNKAKNQKGFTLVELIVVIAILGILAAFAIPKVAGFGDSAKMQRVATEHKMLVSAIQMYKSEKGLDKEPTLTELVPYIEGGEDSLSKKKDSKKLAHSIAGGVLTSQYDAETALVYPEIKKVEEKEQ